MNSNLKKIVMTALFAALSCVATMSIHIPTPGTGGYIHPGDAVALAAGLIYQKLGHSSKTRFTSVILGGIADIVLVAGGYCLCEIFLYGVSGALASVPANIIQGIGGLIISAILYPALIAIPDVRQLAGERAHS